MFRQQVLVSPAKNKTNGCVKRITESSNSILIIILPVLSRIAVIAVYILAKALVERAAWKL